MPAADAEERAEEARGEPDQDERAPAYATSGGRTPRCSRDSTAAPERAGTLPRLRRRARADRRRGPRMRTRRPETRARARAARRALRARRRRQRAGGDDVRERVGVDGRRATSARTGSSSTRRPSAGGERSRDFASTPPWPGRDRAEGPHGRVPLPDAADEHAAVRELESVAAARARRRAASRASGARCSRCCRRVGSNKGRRCGSCSQGAGCSRALVAGDDTTDLDAFRAVDGLELAVRVAVVSDESPTSCARRRHRRRRHRRVPRAAARSLMHVDDESSRRSASASASRRAGVGGRDQRARVGDRDVQPGAHARRDALHPRSARRIALIRKPHFPADIWRPPGGGIKPGEDFVAGASREALEETGLRVELRALPRRRRDARVPQRRPRAARGARTSSSRRPTDEEIAPHDTDEIAEARWGTLDELAGPLRERCSRRARVLALPRRPARRGTRSARS